MGTLYISHMLRNFFCFTPLESTPWREWTFFHMGTTPLTSHEPTIACSNIQRRSSLTTKRSPMTRQILDSFQSDGPGRQSAFQIFEAYSHTNCLLWFTSRESHWKGEQGPFSKGGSFEIHGWEWQAARIWAEKVLPNDHQRIEMHGSQSPCNLDSSCQITKKNCK